jgi:hypothetical protein
MLLQCRHSAAPLRHGMVHDTRHHASMHAARFMPQQPPALRRPATDPHALLHSRGALPPPCPLLHRTWSWPGPPPHGRPMPHPSPRSRLTPHTIVSCPFSHHAAVARLEARVGALPRLQEAAAPAICPCRWNLTDRDLQPGILSLDSSMSPPSLAAGAPSTASRKEGQRQMQHPPPPHCWERWLSDTQSTYGGE